MAHSSVRMEYRLSLAHVDRGVERKETVIVALHPSETLEHLTLRVLAWCLLADEKLTFGPGLSDPDAADLWGHGATGALESWVECGTAQSAKLAKLAQHHSGIALHVVLDDARRRDLLLGELESVRKRPAEITLWLIAPALVSGLGALDARRQKWSVTIVGDHLYVDTGAGTLDGAFERHILPTAR